MHSSIHSSIYSLLHTLHWTFEISVQGSFPEIHPSVISEDSFIDPLIKPSNRPEDQLIETLFPNEFINPSRISFQFIEPFRPSVHRPIQRTVHRSILDHLFRRPFIDPSRRRIHRSIQTIHSFLSWSNPVYIWTIGIPEADYIRGNSRHKSWVE